MNTHEAKRRMPVERSYSSASSTTSSRLSGRRKRRRMKHTVMPLKKRPGRHELACDVHRVSNLDREEMAQSACFWVAKNPVQSGERSFKEEVFVNRDEEFLDEDASYYIENVRQSRQTDEITSQTDSRSADANYSEEKTFYGLRKGKISDGVEVEQFSPLSSPRNQSRLSSVSDDSHSAWSSDGGGMHVGWTSDINNSSGPEYSGANDEESEGEKAGRQLRKNIRSINDEWEESMESHGNRRRRDDESRDQYDDSRDKPTSEGQRRGELEPSDDQHEVVLARDTTSSETKERVDTYESETHSYSSRNGFHSPRDPRGTYLPSTEIGDSTADGRGFYPSDKVRDSERPDVFTGGKARGDFGGDYDRSESRPLESSGYGEVPVFDTGVRTSTPTYGEHPSSDTELLAQRSFDVDEDQLSAHSLPVIDHHKTTTKYYSVEELRGISDTGPSEGVDDRGSEGPHVPRGYGEYEKYEPPRYSRSNDDSAYDVDKPRHVPGTGQGFDEGDKENISPQKERDHLRDKDRWEESKEFYGYRRQKDNHSSDFPASHVSDKPRSRTPLRGGLELSDGQRRLVETYDVNKSTDRVENFERQKSGTSARDSRDSREVKVWDTYPEKDVRDSGYLVSGTRYVYPGADTVKLGEEVIEREQQSETQSEKDHRSTDDKWEESREFYGYRRRQDDGNYPQDERWSGPGRETTKPGEDVVKREQQYETLSQRDHRSTEDKWEESREFYGYRRLQDDENYSQDENRGGPGKDTVKPGGDVVRREHQSDTLMPEDRLEESREFYGYRRRQDDENYSHDENRGGPGKDTVKLGEDVVKREHQSDTLMSEDGLEESREFYGYRRRQDDENYSHDEKYPQDENRGGPRKEILKLGEVVVERGQQPETMMSERDHRSTEDKWEESREFYGYRRRQDDENYSHDENRGDPRKEIIKPGEVVVERGQQPETMMSERDHRSTEDKWEESREFYGYRRRQDDENYSHDENRGDPRKEIIKPGEVVVERGQQPETLMSERDHRSTEDKWGESREFYGYRHRQDDENYSQDENRGGPRKDTVKPGEDVVKREHQSDTLMSEDRLEESREFYGYRRRQDDENYSHDEKYPQDENRGGPRKEIIKPGEVVIERGQQPETLMSERDHRSTEDKWGESREFYGYRRRQDDDNYPQDENRGGPGKGTIIPGEEAIERDQQPEMLVPERNHRSTEDILEESREFYGYRRRQDDGNYPQDENRGGPRKEIIKPGEVIIERGRQPDTPMSERNHRSKEDKWEESGEFYGYRRRLDDEYYSRSASTDSYDKPRASGQRSMDLEPNDGQWNFEEPMEVTSPPSYGRDDTPTDERVGYISGKAVRDMPDSGGNYRPNTDQDVPPGRELRYSKGRVPGEEYLVKREEPVTMSRPADDRQSIITRGYDVTSQRTRYTEQSVRESRESNVAYTKQQTSETEVQEMRPQLNYGRSYPGDRHEQGDYVTREESRDKHRFIGYELPSSKKLGPKPGFQGTTETTTKRLHTRSQRDTIRREARLSDAKPPDIVSDPGIRISTPTPSPRKHGHPPTSDGNKELPTKIRKPAEKVELSKSDPEFSQKFQEIVDKRKKKVKTKHSAKTTTNSTTTKSAAESCNKNVDELVNIFNTLEHLQKPADGKTDKNVAPRHVKRIVEERTLNTPPGKDGKLSPATSISQKLQEIEHILDSVDKNNQQMSREGTGFKPKRQDSYQSSEDSRSTRSSESFNETAKSSDYSEMDTQSSLVTYTTSETRETHGNRQTHETRGKHTWRRDRHGDQPPEMVTKQETMLVESYVESTPDEIFREPRGKRSEQPNSERPWSHDDGYPVTRRPFYSDRAPSNSDERNRNVRRSRDDDDEIYRAQMRKERESSWKKRSSRKKYHESRAYSDGEVEGFRTPFYNRVITPGTPVNIRLYGLNLEKTCLDKSQDLDWAQFGEWEVPVDETISRTEIQRRTQAEEIPGGKPPVRESDIEKSQARPGPGIKWNYPPSFNVHDIRNDELRDGTVTRQEIKWSHPPVSKIQPPEALQKSKVAEVQSPGTQETDIPQAMDDYNDNADQPQEKTQKPKRTFDVTESSRRETIHRNISVKSVRRQSSEERETRTHSKSRTYPLRRISPSKHPSEKNPLGKRPTEDRPWQERLSEERPTEERPSEERLSEERPTEECLSEERPSELLPSEERPSEERPYGITSTEELPVYINAQIWTNETPDELFVEIEYPRIMELGQAEPEIELMNVTDGQLNDEPPEVPVRSSTPKERPESPGWRRDKNVDENTSHVDREEEESERHESSTCVDHTIHTTRTTRTTRTTTETFVKKVRTSGSESTKPDEFIPASGEPGDSTPASSQTDGQPKSEDTSLVAHEYIEVNADTGRPVNVTMLGRVVEDDDEDDLSSQSREDLFLHTRLKIVTEKKMMRPGELPEDVNAHLRGPTTAEQAIDGVDHEGELTDSEHEFEPCIDDSVPIASDHDVTEQLLIPISGLKDERDLVEEDVEKTEVDHKRARALYIENIADHDIVDEPISGTKVDQPKSEVPKNVARDSLEDVFSPRVADEEEIGKERVPLKELPRYELVPGFMDAITDERVESSEKPSKPYDFLNFDEPMLSEEVNEEVLRDSVDEIVLPPVDECVTAESAPSDEAVVPDMDQLDSERRVVDERMSRESVATPTLLEFEHEPVDEMVTSEKRDVEYDFPDFQVAEPEHRTPVDECVSSPQPATRDIYILDLKEMMPEVEKPQSPILVDEVISPKVTVTRDHVIPDIQEVMPEYQEPPVLRLVDENVSSTEKDNEPDIPDFQEVVPEFTDLRPTLIDDVPIPLDEDMRSEGFPECQEPVEEPARNLTMTDSDLEVEVPSLSTESEPSGFLNIEIINESFDTNDDVIDTNNQSQGTYDKTKTKTEYFEVPKKTPEPETRTENEVITETRTQETITIEKTIRKNVHYVSDIPVRNEAREAPESPRKGVSFASSPELKDYSDIISESSSETSLQSSSLGSADASSEVDGSMEVTSETVETVAAIRAARRRRNRRGNRFDNIKRYGPLVPESVVSKSDSPEYESVGSKVPRLDVPRTNVPRSNVPGINVPKSKVPESRVPDNEDHVGKKTDVGEPGTSLFKPERPSRLRPELYLLSSDDGSDSERVGYIPEAEDTTKAVVEETCIPQEKLQVAEASPEETEPSPGAVGEMAQSEEEWEIPVEIAEELEELPEELPVQGSKESLEKEAESAPDEEVEELSQEQIDELLEKEVQGLPEMEKAPETEGDDQLPDKETPESGEDDEDGLTKEKAEVIFEEFTVVDEKLVEEHESFEDEELLEELAEKEREELHEEEIGKPVVKEDEVLSEDEQVSEEFEKSLLQESEEFPKEEREDSPEEKIEKSVDEEDAIPPEGEPMEVPEKVELSCLESVKRPPGEEDGVLVGISEEIEKSLEEKRKDSSEEHLDESEGEEIEKLCEEHEGSIDEGNETQEEFPDVEIDVLAEKITVPEDTFEEKTSPLAQDFTEIPVDVSNDEKKKDEEPTTSSDDDASGSQTDVFGGVSRKEESTVETIIVEKTHSEVCTTVTEITTKRIPGVPTSYSSEDEDDFVQILVDVVDESQDDVAGVVQSEPADEITESDDDKPKSDDDYVNIPVQLETTERNVEAQMWEGSEDEIDSSEKQPIWERASEEESLNSETFPKEAEEMDKLEECVSLEDRSDDKIPVQTVFGILDIQYEAPQIHERDLDFLESSFEETLKMKYSEFPTFEDIRKPDDVPELDDVPESDDVPEPDDDLESDNVAEPEIVLELEIAPEFEQAPDADGLPKPEDVPTKDDDVVLEISTKEEESSESDDGYDGVGSGAWVVIPVQTRDGESQTETDKYSETTQTEETTRTTREISSITEEAYGTNSRILNDSEMQTEMALCSSTTQTDLETNSDFESSSQWYSYKRTEDTTDTYEDEITRVERQRHCSDSQTQTDIPVGDFGSQTHVHRTTEAYSMTDDLRSAATTNDGTQTENKREDGFFNETELTRTIRKTTTETRTKTSYHDQKSTSSSDNQKSDCPVCLQSLEATQYSFIKVTDLSRFVAMQDFGGQTEFDENVTDGESEFFSCGRRQSTEGHRGTWEHSRTTVDKWKQEVVAQSEGSSSATSSGEAHFAIYVEGDDKCSLFCRRVGDHSCMLQKLASIIQANRRATTADRGATTSTHAQQHDVSETSESSETTQEVTKEADVDSGESLGNGACAVIGGERCDVSVQTDGAVLPTDFEVFSEKDFEIYYDGQKSPLWFV